MRVPAVVVKRWLVAVLSLCVAFSLPLVSATAAAQLDEPTAPRLLSTGQTTPFFGNDGEIDEGNRDDGDLIAGRAPRYSQPGPNLISDDNTGLMWIADPGLAGVGAYPWATALNVANSLDYGGHSDWRMPNLKELQTLIDYSRTASVLDEDAFPRPFDQFPSDYGWSSTTSPAATTDAYYVNFLNGHTYPFAKATALGLFPVRDSGTAVDPIALVATGQTVSYGPADDGALRNGTAVSYTLGGPDDQIRTQAENLVTDDNTGLMWIRSPFVMTGADVDAGVGSVASATDLSGAIDWQSALDRVNQLSYGGYSDWRLPNLVELESISQPGAAGGLHSEPAFRNGPVDAADSERHIWWSSTTSAFDRSAAEPGAKAAWYVTTALASSNFISPVIAPAKARAGFVRPVRDTAAPPSAAAGLAEIRSSADFASVTIASPRADILREGKFVVPTAAQVSAAPFDASFQNVSTYPLHLEFLVNEYPGTFAGLTEGQYLGITGTRAARQYWAGGLRSFTNASGETVYGFDIAVDRSDPAELVTEDEVAEVFAALAGSFRRRALVYSPVDDASISAALAWNNPPFEIAFPVAVADPGYEPYTTGRAYGTVRLFNLADLLDAAESGGLSSQDIVVVDGAPSDLVSIVAAIVTGERQSALAHLTIRTARRGTPNFYLADIADELAPYEGQLVRLDATANSFSVTGDVPLAEAQAWWDAIRPDPLSPAVADDVYASLDELAAIGAPAGSVGRIGGKAANLAALFTVLPDVYEVDGFAIPFSAYRNFINSNTLLDTRSDPPQSRTYADYLTSLHNDAEFLADSSVRAAVLADLIDEMRDNGVIDPAFVTAVSDRVDEVFGVGTKVRFRSSSNAEDALEFSGAGLYDSTSACVADATDEGSSGPSQCDPGQDKERTVERALKKVWASLWNFGAWEERDYFGMDHLDTRMGILVSTAFPDERANGVAFTGDPAGLADGYLVNVQDGDTSVVFPESGVVPETNQLTVTNGAVTAIGRIRPSSLVPAGSTVMSDPELAELGSVMAQVNVDLPLDAEGFDRNDILLDFEFKLRREDDQLIFKQVRPFLRSTAAANRQAELRVDVPDQLALCGSWREGLGWRGELAQQLVLTLNEGETVVNYAAPSESHSVFGALRFGDPAVTATGPTPELSVDAVATGTVDVVVAAGYQTADFAIEVAYTSRGLADDQFSTASLSAASLQGAERLTATIIDLSDQSTVGTVRLVPCDPSGLEERIFSVTVEGGLTATFTEQRERFDGVNGLAATTVAAVDGPGVAPFTVTDPAELVYAADRHHWNEQFGVLFDAPIDGHAGLIFTIESGASGVTGYRAAWIEPNRSETPVAIVAVDGAAPGQGPEVAVVVSCLAGNGRVDFNIVNVGSSAATYRVEFEGLSARARLVAPGDWWRSPLTGRADGDYSVDVSRAGESVVEQTVTIACDVPVPQITDTVVSIVNACRAGNGYLLFQFANPTAAAVPYVIGFGNIRNRSTTVAPYGQSVRAVTGRPDGDWDWWVRTGSTIVAEGTVTVDCDG